MYYLYKIRPWVFLAALLAMSLMSIVSPAFRQAVCATLQLPAGRIHHEVP